MKQLVESKLWLYTITALIVINSAVLGLETIESIAKPYRSILTLIDNICLGIFVIEIICRIYVYRSGFFIKGKDGGVGWNYFDLIIILVSLAGSSSLSVLRGLRVVRVFRLLSIIPSMRVVSAAMLHTIPSMLSIGALLLVFYYIYGVLCVNLFGERFPEYFGNLGRSFFTLFQVMTLESWANGIARPIMEVYPYAWIVFVSYIFIVSFIVLNLIVGVVVEGISEIKKQAENNKKSKKTKS